MIRHLNESDYTNSEIVDNFDTLSNNCSEVLNVLKKLTKRVTEIKESANLLKNYVSNTDLDNEDIDYFGDMSEIFISSTEKSYDKVISTDSALFNTWEVIGRIINDCDI